MERVSAVERGPPWSRHRPRPARKETVQTLRPGTDPHRLSGAYLGPGFGPACPRRALDGSRGPAPVPDFGRGRGPIRSIEVDIKKPCSDPGFCLAVGLIQKIP